MLDVAENEVFVQFAEHISRDRIAGMVSGMAAYGNVHASADGVSFVVRVFRASKLRRLEKQLQVWEKYGFLQSKQHG